jgi:fructose-specific component phosphotransferase system IIB-like protein
MQASPACGRVRLHFVGTDYATADRARKTVEPIAAREHVAHLVTEQAARVAYFEALRLLHDADFLLVVGSDDSQYTGSKIYPYVLARKPIVAVLHEQSSAARVLADVNVGPVVTFSKATNVEMAAAILAPRWRALLDRLPYVPDTDWARFAPFDARELTRRQCELFDRVTSRRAN